MDQNIESLLHAVIQGQNLKVHFQPIVHIQTRQIYGYEGLIRGPVNTVLHSPTRLFEAATRAGRLAELDLLCRQLVIKRFAQLRLPGRLFINVDPFSLVHEHSREGQTLEFIEQAGVNPSQVIIELTETHPVEDVQLMQQAMVHYRQMGFRVALDDLGASYSGLKLWSEIRPDIVKIDRHFIQGVDQDRTKQQFVSAILKTATALGCRVITEGVETGKGRLIDLLHEITKLQVNRARHANPLTLLPGNVPIQQQLQKLFRQNIAFTVCYFDLDNFKPFNDFFGFSRGDKVLRFVSELLVANIDDQEDFIGHIGGDDFVAIFHSIHWQATVERILQQFDDSIGGLYNGHIGCVIKTTDREGVERQYRQMTLSVGAVVVRPTEWHCHIDLSEEASIAKHHAKAMPGSTLYIHELASEPHFALAGKSPSAHKTDQTAD
ncbi:GGDEF domain-containing protein [uncultured Desulfobulbus sp.]|uniref:GGDEF domain-containing protein n=1 Tax=uncultured Desulfobulbus sp. TaxID=239745 RepID=UPI0029C6CFB1|nr:GGDEF domain-containing protein [uncultured Desulfobulbus sp.]